MGHHYGHHLMTVGDHKITCSWDEVGMRTRAQMDYHPHAPIEFRKFLKDVWFRDAGPDRDTNRDGRTYNAFTGERLTNWDQVEPIRLSLDWTQPGWNNDGTQKFSARADVDKVLFDQPGRYKLWIDFHRYFTFEFFRRVNDAASRKMNAMGTKGRVTCYPFVQHFIIWPGMNQRHGNSFYWYHRLSPVVNVEHSWPDAPVMNLNYAITDRLAPKWKNTVMGWVWFYFGREGYDMYNGPHDIDRAMARIMGHVVDGTHHWLYSPVYRGRDQKQRLQIAYWQNFLATHYQTFLNRSAPPQPQVAVLMPDWTGYYYRAFQYPKQDWAYTAEALQNLQYPYHIITEEELELNRNTLDGYKVLYVIGSEWTTPAIRQRITDFLAAGGVVFANVDSLTLDIPTGRRTDFLEKTFGVKISHKHKNSFYPSTQDVAEAEWALPFDRWASIYKLQGHLVHLPDDPRAWAKLYKRTSEKYVPGPDNKPKRDTAGRPIRDPGWKMVHDRDGNLVRDEAAWKQLDSQMAKMPRQVRGIKQTPLDMRNPPEIRYDFTASGGQETANGGRKPAGMASGGREPADEPGNERQPADPSGGSRPRLANEVSVTAVTWGEVNTAQVVRGKPIAWWGDEVVGVETDNTVWLGTREGTSIHAISPRMPMHRATEPCNPYPPKTYDTYEVRRPYAEALGHAAAKAGVVRPVTLMQGERLPLNLEILPRVDADGTLMVIVVNHDETQATYQVAVDDSLMAKLAGAEAWDMLTEKTIESNTDGRFDLTVPAWGVSVLMIAKPSHLRPIKAAQARLNRKDMSVPKYFRDRRQLNEGEWNTPVPPIGT
jgi:hypothetical protein